MKQTNAPSPIISDMSNQIKHPEKKERIQSNTFNSTEELDSWGRIIQFTKPEYDNYSIELDVVSISENFVAMKASLILTEEGSKRVLREAVVSNHRKEGDMDDLFVNACSTMAYGKVLAFAGIGGSPMRLEEEQRVWLERLKAQAKSLVAKSQNQKAFDLCDTIDDEFVKSQLLDYVSELVSNTINSEI